MRTISLIVGVILLVGVGSLISAGQITGLNVERLGAARNVTTTTNHQALVATATGAADKTGDAVASKSDADSDDFSIDNDKSGASDSSNEDNADKSQSESNGEAEVSSANSSDTSEDTSFDEDQSGKSDTDSADKTDNPKSEAEAKPVVSSPTTPSTSDTSSFEDDLSSESTAPTTSAAKSSGDSVTQNDIQGLRNDIATLRDQWQRTQDRNTARSTRNLLVTGTIQSRYTASQDKATPSTFDVANFILAFSGNLKKDYGLGKNVNYLVSLFNNTTSGDYRFRPLDAYINIAFLPTLSPDRPLLNAWFGQQKLPFGVEAQATEEQQPTIRAAQFASKLGLSTRDIGLTFRGDLKPYVDYGSRYRVPLVEYAVGVVNGSGQDTADTNAAKDLVWRVAFHPVADYNSKNRGITLGTSFYRGIRSVTAHSLGTHNRQGVDLSWVRSPIGFTAEYAQGQDDTLVGSNVKTVKADGYAVTFFFNFGQKFVADYLNQDRYDDWYPATYQPFIRYDKYDPDTSISNNETTITTYGFNWYFAQTTKLQLNYNVKKETPDIKNNEFLVQFQFGF